MRKSDRDAYVPDLINASDVLLGKLGYGTTSEANPRANCSLDGDLMMTKALAGGGP